MREGRQDAEKSENPGEVARRGYSGSKTSARRTDARLDSNFGYTIDNQMGRYKGEQVMEERDHKAQTCDMWGHIIKEPLPTKPDDRPKATSECDRRGWLRPHLPPQLSSTDRGHHQPPEDV